MMGLGSCSTFAFLLVAADRVHQLVKLRQEPRTVRIDEWSRAASELARLSQHIQEGTGSQGVADCFVSKLDSLVTQNSSTALETAIGQRDVRRDRDIAQL